MGHCWVTSTNVMEKRKRECVCVFVWACVRACVRARVRVKLHRLADWSLTGVGKQRSNFVLLNSWTI